MGLGAQAEVDQLEALVVVEKEVLGLEVAVRVAARVDVGERRDYLAEEEARLRLRQTVLRHDVVEQLPARAVLVANWN